MEKIITDYINAIEFGDAQTFRNMTVIPLYTSVNHVPDHLTLKKALEAGVLTVTEIDASGSVPELLAKNAGDLPILLLDGEELTGAKQNRVLNTTILLREKSETLIPVSCTEHGRWHYSTPEFHDSDVIMAKRAMAKKARTVSNSLRNEKAYRSDQGQVWDDIANMSLSAGVSSDTGAMRDVYESRKASLDEYIEAFPPSEGQKGVFVLIGGKVVGFDVVSLGPAYADLHLKIVKSYAVDAFIEGMKSAVKKGDSHKVARAFFEELPSCTEERYKSLGHGMDHRFEGTTTVGSALVAREKVIHMAFFKADQSERIGRMSGSAQRRANRSRRS